MSVRTDVINLTVNVNGNAAQNQLNELRKRAQDVKLEMDSLKKGTQEYIDKKAELAGITAQMSELKKTIGITSLSQKELTAELRKLTALKGSVQPFTQEFKDLQKQIDLVQNRLYDVKNGVQGFASFFSKVNDQVKQFGLLAAGYLGFQFITTQFQNIISGAGKLSDQLADLRRVSGLTADQAKELNSALGKIDTRTATTNLRDIAIVAGKLGVAKDDIFSFTKAVDQLVVALGDELGDADQITTSLGKILNVFDGKITGDNISKLGNAIVDLANKGVATGGFVVDFTQRLSGIAKASNLSLAAVLGLGAGLEENGAKVESAATAITRLINNIALDIPKAAKIAGQSADSFAELFAKKPQEALLAYAAGLQKNKASFAEVASSFKDAGEEGARVVSTLALLGQRTDFFIQKINDTGVALQNTDEITNAFALKNETLGAELDKLGKQFYNFVQSSGVTSFLKGLVSGFSDFLGILKNIPKWIDANKISFYGLIAAVIAYNAAAIKSGIIWAAETAEIIANTVVKKASAIATAIAEVATAAYIVVTSALTGQITLATAAQRLWNIASSLGAGAIGGIIAAGVILVNVLEKIFTNNSKIAIQQKAQADLARSAAEAYGDQVNKLEILKRALEDSNTSLETKKQAYKELIAINPEFAKTLQLDINGHLQGAQAIDIYIAQLKKKGEAEAAQNLSNQKNQEILQLQQQRYERSLKSDAPDKYQTKGSGAFQFDIGEIDDKIKALQIAKDFFDKKITSALAAPAEQKQLTQTVSKSIDNSVAAREAYLKAKIQELQDAYLQLNATDIKGQKANLALQKQFQDELDKLEGKEAKKTAADHSYDELLKEAEAFHKKIQELSFTGEQASKSQNQKEIDDVKHKYDVILSDYQALVKKLKAAGNVKGLQILGSDDDIKKAEKQELDALDVKQQKEDLTKAYDDQKIVTQKFYDDEKEAQNKRFVDREINEKVYRANVAHIDAEAQKAQLAVAEKYAAITITVDGKQVQAVAEAAKDVTALKKAQLDQQTKDLIAAYRAQEAERELITKLDNAAATNAIEVGISLAKNKGDKKGVRQGQSDLLDEQHKQDQAALEQQRTDALAAITETGFERIKKELAINADINLAKLKNDQDYYDKKKQNALDQIDFEKAQAEKALGYASQAATILDNLDQRSLSKEKKKNDDQAAVYKKQLDGRLISQKKYDSLIAKQDEEFAKKKHDADVKAFKRQKALGIAQALIDGISAIAKTFAQYGWPVGIPFAAGMAAVTALNVATIASQPPPEAGQGKLLSDGPYHRDKEKGLHVVNPRTGKTELLLEKDEMVIKGAATRSNQTLTVTGTPKQIGSKLNSMHGGVSWAPGAWVSSGTKDVPKWRTTAPPSINYNMPKIMEQGGIIRPLSNGPSPKGEGVGDEASNNITALLTRSNELMQMQIEVAEKHIDVDLQKSDKIRGVFSIKELNDLQAKYTAAQKASGIN